MKQNTFLALFMLGSVAAMAQLGQQDPKFSNAMMVEDLAYIRSQIFHAHAYPFTEIDSIAYERRFEAVENTLPDSASAIDFAKLVKPLFAPLSDEHARISVPIGDSYFSKTNVFLPFSLKKQGPQYVVDRVLGDNTGLQPGTVISAVNGQKIEFIIDRCAKFTTGFPDQRRQKAMVQFGIVYAFAFPPNTQFGLTTEKGTIMADGVMYDTWRNYLNNKNGNTECPELIQYQNINGVGYINFCSFMSRTDSVFNLLRAKIDDIFKQIKAEKVNTLVVDVSRNSGGNSACGDLLIDYITDKPFRSYGCRWKRSDEYLKLITQWGITDEFYQSQPVGSTIVFDQPVEKPTKKLKNRYKGKTYVVVGPGTFSSAIMFATIIKDNRLATLVGQTPENGHPNHFGEMYNSTTPNLKLDFNFGVKEWIRPSGERGNNELTPDLMIDLNQYKTAPERIKAIRGE